MEETLFIPDIELLKKKDKVKKLSTKQIFERIINANNR